MRFTYGISERQFGNYIKNAMETHGASPADTLHQQLELRLDNVVYRLGLAATRRAARQMVSHGHILVNGRKTTIPSRAIHPGDRIGIREGSRSTVLFENFAERMSDRPKLSAWLTWDAKAMEGGVEEVPTAEAAEPAGDLANVISFYSR